MWCMARLSVAASSFPGSSLPLPLPSLSLSSSSPIKLSGSLSWMSLDSSSLSSFSSMSSIRGMFAVFVNTAKRFEVVTFEAGRWLTGATTRVGGGSGIRVVVRDSRRLSSVVFYFSVSSLTGGFAVAANLSSRSRRSAFCGHPTRKCPNWPQRKHRNHCRAVPANMPRLAASKTL